MPSCPHCQTPYHGRPHFCPQCGASLESEAPGGAKPPPGPRPSMQPWVLTVLLGAALIIVVLLGVWLRSGTPPTPSAPTPPPQAVAPAPPAPSPAPSAPAVAPAPASAPELREQLQAVLAAMRTAHLNKDIDQYLNCYSPAFPGLEQKRQETLAAWNNFDFLNAFYALEDIRPAGENTVNASVTWTIETLNRRTQESASAKQTYRVRFAREEGAWRIQALEEVK